MFSDTVRKKNASPYQDNFQSNLDSVLKAIIKVWFFSVLGTAPPPTLPHTNKTAQMFIVLVSVYIFIKEVYPFKVSPVLLELLWLGIHGQGVGRKRWVGGRGSALWGHLSLQASLEGAYSCLIFMYNSTSTAHYLLLETTCNSEALAFEIPTPFLCFLCHLFPTDWIWWRAKEHKKI